MTDDKAPSASVLNLPPPDKRCMTCKFWKVESYLTKLNSFCVGDCSCGKFIAGYGYHPKHDGTLEIDGVAVECDEGWMFHTCESFCCIHWEEACTS